MPKATQKNITKSNTRPRERLELIDWSHRRTAFAQTADAELFRLHDRFCDAYVEVLFHRKAGGGGAGSLASGTKAEKAVQRKFERACDEATERARAVINAPALTLEGMLMKIHVAGFNFTWTKPGTFSAPYHGMICEGGLPQHWEIGDDRDELALIASIRSDLYRFSGRRV
jgi:hypothetical protein